MMKRKPQTVLSVEKKHDIIRMREQGANRTLILKKYDTTVPCLGNIYTEHAEIKRLFQAKTLDISRSRKRTGWLHVTDLEKIVYQLYLRCRQNRIQMTGSEIQKKALEINEKLKGAPDFNASCLWLDNFRYRHRMTDDDVRKDFPIRTTDAMDNFKACFNKLLKDEFTLENVYNVVHTVIMWKGVPEKTSMFNRAKKAGNQQMLEDHITALFCANATGCHKLPILIIGSIGETQGLYNLNTEAFSTIYRANVNAKMNSNIFNEWFRKHFLKSVIERQMKKGRREKTLLLLDNTNLLYDLNDLNRKDKFVTVISIPLSISPLRQPMNCGIIASFKRKFRNQLVTTLASLPLCNTEDDVIDMHDKLDMWDCCSFAYDAWSYVDDAILRNAWDAILNRDVLWSGQYSIKMKYDAVKTIELLHSLPGCERCDEASVFNWFEMDETCDIIMKICTNEVVRDFEDKNVDRVNTNFDDEAGPSHSKVSKMS
ncbi:jerky protein homolog-like [Bombus vosnesenskii]|uniref:Jerky protein homolog-like n=1 Tax=Bombus vosnesenskii TaxID=207650 RepID=A0A6J3KWZ6_9HYME|nr:jerky protein homolog-like [Bombus vosnesenskii]